MRATSCRASGVINITADAGVPCQQQNRADQVHAGGRTMRILVAALVALVFVCCATRSVVAQDPSEKPDVKADFELVDKIGTRPAYELFLSVHKTGPYAHLVRQRLHQMDPDGRTRRNSNWGDDIFIPRLIERNK
jgi:hypothetical protein